MSRKGSSLALLAALLRAVPASAADPILIEEGPDGQDTAVYSFLPALARGDYPSLYAFTASEAGVDHSFRSFMRFDPSQEIAAGACVASAELYVYYGVDVPPGYGGSVTTPGELSCHPVLEAWDEMTATWANQPMVGPPVSEISGIDAFDFYSCDVTGPVQGWIDGSLPNYGLALFSASERGLGFYSFEAQVSPFLKSALAVTLSDSIECPEPAGQVPLALAVLAALASERRR